MRNGLTGGVNVGLIGGLIGGVNLGIMGGLKGQELEIKIKPNQGIRFSVYNAILTAL